MAGPGPSLAGSVRGDRAVREAVVHAAHQAFAEAAGPAQGVLEGGQGAELFAVAALLFQGQTGLVFDPLGTPLMLMPPLNTSRTTFSPIVWRSPSCTREMFFPAVPVRLNALPYALYGFENAADKIG